MKKKLTLLAFSLLLAVGWTNDASAQLLPKYEEAQLIEEGGNAQRAGIKAPVSPAFANAQAHKVEPMTMKAQASSMMKAPRRVDSNTSTAPATHTRAWYSNYQYTWYDANNVSHTASLTDSVTNPYQLYYLTAATFVTPAIPGILYSDAWDWDVPYYSCGYKFTDKGYNISGTRYEDLRVRLQGTNALIQSIYVYNKRTDATLGYWTGGNLPTNWASSKPLQSRTVSSSTWYYMDGGGSIIIPHSVVDGNDSIYIKVYVRALSDDDNAKLILTPGGSWTLTSSAGNRTSRVIAGGVEPPTENGYTVFLVQLKDDADYSNVTAQTTSFSELITYFNTYIKSMQILTDGMRVKEGTDEAGTVFAYQGVIDKFFFASKGKMFFARTDRAPFYSMYEEFSPYVQSESSAHNQKDLYSNMRAGEYYPVVHDCQSVIYLNHFFSMAGKDTIAPKSCSPLVFYIPDNRVYIDSARTYRADHQPQIGLYQINLTAETEPSATYAQDSTYTVTLDWTSNLDDMVNSTVDQTYIIYTVTFDEQGNRVYHPLDTLVNPETLTYSYDVPQTQTSQQITYVILGYPTDATNNYARDGIFYTYSNLDDVQIPGWFDFMILYRERYESDFIIHEEKNYYRNYLYPTNLSHGTGMTMGQLKTEWPDQTASYTLWRDNTGVAVLEVKAIGKKVYYRIRYYDDTQVTTGVNDIEIPNGYQTISND